MASGLNTATPNSISSAMRSFLRSSARAIRRHPASSAASVAMAAIGIALLTLGLAVADAARWRVPPFPNGHEALVVYTSYETPREVRPRVGWSFPRLHYVREHATTFDRVTSWTPASLTLTGRSDPETVAGEFVSHEYFPLLGVAPVSGRSFAPEEDLARAPEPVAIVSAAFRLRRALLGDPVDVGSTFRLNGHIVTVVGVLPAGFRGLSDRSELWLPTPMAARLTYPEYLTTDQDFITLLARVRPGRTIAEVRREVAALSAAAHRVSPSSDAAGDARVAGTAESLGTARVRPEGGRGALLALGGSALLFLLTSANLVALLLARGAARRRETAVTIALGATPARIWRVQALEGALVVLTGAVIAVIGIAAWLRLAGPFDPLGSVGRGFLGTFSSVAMDGRLLAWWALSSLLAILGVATLPAAWALRHATLDHLREGSHGSAATGVSLRRPGAAAAILTLESALAVILVVAAGQLLESYRRLQGVDVGVDPTHVLTFELQPSEGDVPPQAAPGFIDRVLASVREVPGVQSASVDGGAPLAGSATTALHIVGRADDPVAGAPIVLRHYVGPEHFATLGIPLLAGRGFTEGDRADAPRVVAISASAARRYFPAGDALGQRVWFEGSTLTSPDSSAEIVGIVGDVKYDNPIGERTTASFYTPYAQFTYGWRVYFVRVSGEPRLMQRSIAAAVHRVAPDLPLRNVRPLEEILQSSRDGSRRAAIGTGALALLGIVLAVCGIWAVVSHVTAQRRRDMAIRMAHGATPARVLRLVLGEGLAWPVLGLAVGAMVAGATSRVLRAVLYGIAPGDPAIVAAGAVIFLLAAVGACLVPAWRASRTSPIEALRAD